MKKKMKTAAEKAMLPEMKKEVSPSKSKKSKKKFNFLAMIGKKKKK